MKMNKNEKCCISDFFSAFIEQLDTCQVDLGACKTALSASSPHATSMFHLMEANRRQLSQTQEALQEATDHVTNLTKELIEQRQKATQFRHENFDLIMKNQELEERITFSQ